MSLRQFADISFIRNACGLIVMLVLRAGLPVTDYGLSCSLKLYYVPLGFLSVCLRLMSDYNVGCEC